MVHLVFDSCVPIGRVTLGDSRFTVSELQEKVEEHIKQLIGCADFDFYLLHNGKLLQNREEISEGDIYVIPKLCGGKGGFGSMLRAIGAQIEKTTNREACRDLSGRRLRDINEEKRLKKWLAEQAEREQEALEKKRKKLERLNEDVKHEFKDEDYIKARLEMPDKIHEAVEQGLKASTEEPSPSSSSQEVRKVETSKEPSKKNKAKKKRKLWVDDMLDVSESNSESEDEPLKRIKLS